jgi:hypothetical protein
MGTFLHYAHATGQFRPSILIKIEESTPVPWIVAKVKINLLEPGWRGAEIADHTPLQTGLEDAYAYAYDTTGSAEVPPCTPRAIEGVPN